MSNATKLTFVFAALLVLAIPEFAQTPGVTGDWELIINSPQGSRTANATFKQDGEKLSGVLRGARGELPIEGTVKGKEVKFSYPYKNAELEFTITMTGTLDGDAIKGTADYGGLAEGDWTAKRTTGAKIAPSAPAVVASQTNDVTGVWNFAVETPQGSGTPTFTFKQEGEKLTGQYKGAFGEAPVTGTVKGNKIDFSFKASGPVEGTVTYTGTIDGNTMKGTAKFGDLGEATWTAKKQ